MSEKGVSRCKSRERKEKLKKDSSEEGYLMIVKSHSKSQKKVRKKCEKEIK